MGSQSSVTLLQSAHCRRKTAMKLNPLQDDLVELFAHADARQVASARAAVAASTEKSLRGRKLTTQNMRGVIKLITRSTAAGAAQNTSPPADVQALLSTSLQGIDDALQRTVEASEQALQGFIDEGVDVRDTEKRARRSGKARSRICRSREAGGQTRLA
jgi:flagellar hook-basal body complex protein FliE